MKFSKESVKVFALIKLPFFLKKTEEKRCLIFTWIEYLSKLFLEVGSQFCVCCGHRLAFSEYSLA